MFREPTLLATTTIDQLSAATRYLSRPGSSRETMIFLLFAVVLGAIWTTIFLWDRLRKNADTEESASRSLFDELCLAHRLEHSDIALLSDAALECGLESPASLFVQPDRFDALCTETQPRSEVYRRLRDRLFGPLP